jgi:hypothetical protein
MEVAIIGNSESTRRLRLMVQVLYNRDGGVFAMCSSVFINRRKVEDSEKKLFPILGELCFIQHNNPYGYPTDEGAYFAVNPLCVQWDKKIEIKAPRGSRNWKKTKRLLGYAKLAVKNEANFFNQIYVRKGKK